MADGKQGWEESLATSTSTLEVTASSTLLNPIITFDKHKKISHLTPWPLWINSLKRAKTAFHSISTKLSKFLIK